MPAAYGIYDLGWSGNLVEGAPKMNILKYLFLPTYRWKYKCNKAEVTRAKRKALNPENFSEDEFWEYEVVVRADDGRPLMTMGRIKPGLEEAYRQSPGMQKAQKEVSKLFERVLDK